MLLFQKYRCLEGVEQLYLIYPGHLIKQKHGNLKKNAVEKNYLFMK